MDLPILVSTSSNIFCRLPTHRQQSLHHLAHTAQPKCANSKCELQHLAPRCLEDPVERERDEEEGDEVQHFVGLLVARDGVVGRGEAGCGRDEEESGEGGCCNRKLLFSQYFYSCAIGVHSGTSPAQPYDAPTPKTNTTSYIPANGFRIRILNSSSVL